MSVNSIHHEGIDADLMDLGNGIYDFQINSFGDIQTKDAFDAAIIVSLFTDARADESEITESHLRRGWSGNEDTPGQQMGGTLWVYETSRDTEISMNDIRNAVERSLQWMVDQDIAQSIRVSGSVGLSYVKLDVWIYYSTSKVEHRYFEIWRNTGV